MSFTKAAEELNVTPAAISQQVKTLEDYVGTPLFHRLTRGLALTKTAQAALPALSDGFIGVAQGMQRLRHETDKDRLDVWMAPSFASKWLMPRLNRFTAKHPNIDLRVSASDELFDHDSNGMQSQAAHFHRHGMDVAIRFGDGHYPGCRVDRLMTASVVPLCSPTLISDPNRPLQRPEDLFAHTLLHDDTEYEGRPDWSHFFEKAGLEISNGTKGLHFNHVSLALEAACDGQGVVLSIEQLARNDLEKGRLVVPFDLRLPLDCSYYIISLPESAENSCVSAFRQWLLDESVGISERPVNTKKQEGAHRQATTS